MRCATVDAHLALAEKININDSEIGQAVLKRAVCLLAINLG